MQFTVFFLLSADPFGPFLTKNFVNSRHSTPMYCHMMVCLNYGAMWMGLSEGNTTSDVISSILELQCRYEIQQY